MRWKPGLLLALLLVGWTFQWVSTVHSQRQQSANALASLLGSEIQVGLESHPFHVGPALARVSLLPGLRGARVESVDGSRLWSFGDGGNFEVSQAIAESGQLLATLHLNYANPQLPLPLTLAWLVGMVACLWSRRGTRCAPALVLELDEKRRIRRLSGNASLLAGQAGALVGQSLDELMGDVSGRTVSELHGSAARGLVVVRDSQDLRKVQRRLKQLELHYRQLCNGAHDLIFLMEPEGNLVFLNRSLQARVAAPTRLEQLFAAASYEKVRTQLHDTLLDEKSGEFEANLILSDSTCIPVSGTLSRTSSDDSSPLTVLGIFRDLSVQRATEARLAQAQKMEALGLLAGGVAHDFNNFLGLFTGLVQLVRLDMERPEAVEEYLQEMDKGIESAAELTRQLLQFNFQKGNERQHFALDPVVKDFVRLTSRLLGRSVVLETNLQSGAELLGEKSHLEQIVLNLLINARDAMPQGGLVRLTTRRCGDRAELKVVDQGHGMSKEVAARIFEPYYTTKEPGKGTGLGLATVYAVVIGWGGEISLQSHPGAGTTFTILLPLA